MIDFVPMAFLESHKLNYYQYFHLYFQSINSCGEGESFPFANDNAGTIRMRTNGLGPQAMLDDDESGDLEEVPSTPSDDTNSNEASSQRSLHKYVQLCTIFGNIPI